MRLGLHFGHAYQKLKSASAARQLVEVAHAADGLGYDSLWLVDPAGGTDQFAALAAMAGATRRARLGTGVASIFHRHPLGLAAAARTVDDLSDGRMVLGLGTSHRELVADIGVAWRKPFAAMQEAFTIIRGLLDGQTLDFRGAHFRVRGRLQPPPRRRMPIYLGAVQPRMLRFAGAVADGVFLNHLTPSYAPHLVAEVRAGAAEAGRDPAAVELICSVPTYVARDEGEARIAREARKAALGTYVGFEIYRRRYAAMGFGAEMDAIAAAQARGEPIGPLVPDAMVAQMVNAGSVAECRAVIEQYRAAGADTYLIVTASPPGEVAPLLRTLEALAPSGGG
jgi:alkanesulfonate monooxygenase SsuD/methylene tetrahydromethanopterin reductase-like flavin-dependent oxidoreductase (luciferase family)